MTAQKKFAVVNSVPNSNYTKFEIKTWNPKTQKSELFSAPGEYSTRISAKHAVDDNPKLTRVNSFREAAGRVTGVAVPPKPGHAGRKTTTDDTSSYYVS